MLLSLNHQGLHVAEKHTDIGNALRPAVNGCGGSTGTPRGTGPHRSPLTGSQVWRRPPRPAARDDTLCASADKCQYLNTWRVLGASWPSSFCIQNNCRILFRIRTSHRVNSTRPDRQRCALASDPGEDVSRRCTALCSGCQWQHPVHGSGSEMMCTEHRRP